MEIVFIGICCWVDAKLPGAGKNVIIRNATRGGSHRGVKIPPHSAFIHAKRHQVESANWAPRMTVDDNLFFELEGDTITFDPQPGGGTIDVSDLPHVRERITKEPICPAADEIRPGFRDEPDPMKVLGLVHLPADAPVSTSSNGNGAMFATLLMPDNPVTITATPFSGVAPRSLKVIDPTAHLFVANVTLDDYLRGHGPDEDNHQYLVCEMFKPHVKTTSAQSHAVPSGAPVMSAQLSGISPIAIDHSAFSGISVAPAKSMQDFLCTFAAGCSDSQWP